MYSANYFAHFVQNVAVIDYLESIMPIIIHHALIHGPKRINLLELIIKVYDRPNNIVTFWEE